MDILKADLKVDWMENLKVDRMEPEKAVLREYLMVGQTAFSKAYPKAYQMEL